MKKGKVFLCCFVFLFCFSGCGEIKAPEPTVIDTLVPAKEERRIVLENLSVKPTSTYLPVPTADEISLSPEKVFSDSDPELGQEMAAEETELIAAEPAILADHLEDDFTQVQNEDSEPCADCIQLSSEDKPTVSEFLIVTNSGEELNGDLSSPTALIANPGSDGISLAEAIIAAEATSDYDVIQFDPSLSGSVINVVRGVPFITQGNLTIDGDIDDDTVPDIILDGRNSAYSDGIPIIGASNVTIRGLSIRNFGRHGISLTINPQISSSSNIMENITLFQNTITVPSSAIELLLSNQDHAEIRNVEIISNTLVNSGGGIAIMAGMGPANTTDNKISDVSIVSNVIDNPGYTIAIFLSPSSSSGLSNNSLQDIKILGNQIRNHDNSSILIDASNQMNCNNNTVDGVLIAENRIDGDYVTIEVLSESGSYSTGNVLRNLTIQRNVLTGGGIHFAVATGYNAHQNTMSSVVVEQNHITSALANGIYVIAGSGGAYQNRFENAIFRNNFIMDCSDAGILLHGDTSSSPNNVISGVTITNQTLINNGNSWAGGININTKNSSNIITGVTVSNSILWGNEGGDAFRGALVPDLVSYNLLGDLRFVGTNHNFYQLPEFSDPASGDYHLSSTSPCVDAGDPSALSIGAQDLDTHFRLGDGNNDSIPVVDLGAWELNTAAAQEINLRGNGFTILDGDVVPVFWDGTDFGKTMNSVQQVFSIENTGAASLNLTGTPIVEIGGENAEDFSIVSQPEASVPGGDSVSFTVEFTPQAAGLRKAVVMISNDDDDENPYTFVVWGTGVEIKEPVSSLFLPLVLH